MAKANKAEVAKRIEEVLAIRLDGAARHNIRQYASEKGWEISDRQIDRYIRTADQQLAAALEKKRKLVVGLHLARRESLYARAINAGDFRTALAIIADIAKLQGLYPSDKELRELARLAIEQEKRLRELEAKLDSGERGTAAAPPDAEAPRPLPSIGGDARPDAI